MGDWNVTLNCYASQKLYHMVTSQSHTSSHGSSHTSKQSHKLSCCYALSHVYMLNFCLQFLPVMATCSVWVIKCQKSVSNLINTRSTPYMYLAITKPNQVTRQLILSLASQVIVQVDFMQTKVDNKSKNVVAFSTNLKLLVCDRHRL